MRRTCSRGCSPGVATIDDDDHERERTLHTYLLSIQNAEAAAAVGADDGIIELPTVNARAQGVVAIQRFLNGLLTKVPDFRFENVRLDRNARPGIR